MAYDAGGVRFLFHAADLGVDYANTATLGHQYLFATQADVAEALAVCRGVTSSDVAASVYRDCAGWVDGILRYLGASHVDSIDASAFEGCTLVHDLNQPISPELEERYSAVVDGGTIEHVFDFPTAIRNCMRMVRQGGHLILHMPVNNYPGHGFYQFSPDLLFRVLSPRFGFSIRDALIIEIYHPRPRWFRVTDPMTLGRSFMFRSYSRTILWVLAERVGPVPEFIPPPIQSTYTTAWETSGALAKPATDNGQTPVTPLSPSSVAAPRAGIMVRAKALYRRALPEHIRNSKDVERLRVWIGWLIPPLGYPRHYSSVPGFEPVHEQWTAPGKGRRFTRLTSKRRSKTTAGTA